MKQRSIVLFFFILILGIVFLTLIITLDTNVKEEAQQEKAQEDSEKCEILGGTYLKEYNECENINQNQCEILGGSFSECESACRHNPNAEFCILVCVPVCNLG